MRLPRLAAAPMVSLVVVACADGRDLLGPGDPALEQHHPTSEAAASAARRIEGRLAFSDGVAGRLDADAIVAVGGDHHGSVVVR